MTRTNDDLKFSEVKNELSIFEVVLTRTHEEFRVNTKEGNEDTAYYTDSLKDARDTAYEFVYGDRTGETQVMTFSLDGLRRVVELCVLDLSTTEQCHWCNGRFGVHALRCPVPALLRGTVEPSSTNVVKDAVKSASHGASVDETGQPEK